MAPGRRSSDLTLQRLEDMVYNAEKLANESRAEFRAVREEIMRELRVLRFTIDGDPLREAKGLKQQMEALRNAFDGLKEDRGFKIERGKIFWASITAVTVQLLFLSAMLVLNWDRVETFVTHLWAHRATVETVAAKPKKQRPKRKPKPIVIPEVKDESTGEEVP